MTAQTLDIADLSPKSDWRDFYSDYSQYILEDLLLHNLFFRRRPERTKFEIFLNKLAHFFDSFFFVFLFLSVIVFASIDLFARSIPIHFYQFPESETFFRYALPILAILISSLMLRERVARKKLQEELTAPLDDIEHQFWMNSKYVQIIPSAGTIRFCFGSEGFFVDGVNIHYKMEWNTFRKCKLNYLDFAVRVGADGSTQKIDIEPASSLNDATHAVIFFPIEANQYSSEDERLEFLIIPRRFFESSKNSVQWQSFMQKLDDKINSL